MNSRKMIKFGLSALVLGGVAVTGVATQGFTNTAFATAGASAKKAASEAKDARKAIAKRKAGEAVQHAEAAVANDPANAEYRALLGQAYLLAGRFTSASQALADALTLNPQDGRVALNLALAKVAQGDWAGARTMLQAHAGTIPASDRGLAFALAGDPVTAVDILGPAVREATATAKTRQNFALSLALAGCSDRAASPLTPEPAPPAALLGLDPVLSLVGPEPVSLDGFIATRSGDSQFVTGDDNMVHMHRLRALCDAVVVGAGLAGALACVYLAWLIGRRRA